MTPPFPARGNDFFLNKLEKLYDEEKILIEKTDTLDTELREGKGYPAGEKKSSQYVESFGQALVGHSRVGTSLVGDPDDSKRLSRILTLLWGSKPQSAYKKNCLRDSMHLSTQHPLSITIQKNRPRTVFLILQEEYN